MKIVTFSALSAKQKITPPSDDISNFHTAGRMLSYFPQVNQNGIAFFREDVKPILSSLLGATVDINHVKPCNPEVELVTPGMKNTTMGAIVDYVEDDEGIDILCKNQLDLAKSMGFTPEDFRKGGMYSSYSQECDHLPPDSSWIVVDKNDPTKIVSELSFMDGLVKGYRRSHVVNGKWDYFTVDGNPVYIRVKPISFVGVGHVAEPADASATVYARLLSSIDTNLSSFYPGMDDGPDAPKEMLGSEPGALGDDKNIFAQDFMMNPDLLMPSSLEDKAGDGPAADDPSRPDSHYAAVWAEPHPEKGLGEPVKRRGLPVRDKKGNLDRASLIHAYHSLTGMRGDTLASAMMPTAVKAHALQQIREGLKATKQKENSSHMDPKDLEVALAPERAKFAELQSKANEKDTTIASLTAKVAELEAAVAVATSAKETEVASKATEISELQAALKEYKDKELASVRLAELEKIHPFKEGEKTEEFVRSLASIDDGKFDNLVLRREIAKRDDLVKASELASIQNGGPRAPYTPRFTGTDHEKFKNLTVSDLLP